MAKKKDTTKQDLNTIWVPIPRLRLELAKISKDGFEKYPLGDLLSLIYDVYKETKDVEV